MINDFNYEAKKLTLDKANIINNYLTLYYILNEDEAIICINNIDLSKIGIEMLVQQNSSIKDVIEKNAYFNYESLEITYLK